MIKTALVLLTSIMLSTQALSQIKNGFEKTLVNADETLCNLENLLQIDKSNAGTRNLSFRQNEKLKSEIRRVEQLMQFKKITADLIEQFQSIAPNLYEEIDNITDNKGTPVNVYVKFLPYWKMKYSPSGTTRLSYEEESGRIYTKEYGINSVSIHISFHEAKALHLLAHEFGHLRYIVPNIREYHEFYEENYSLENGSTLIGHSSDDPSRKYARDFIKRFKLSENQYRKRMKPPGDYLASDRNN